MVHARSASQAGSTNTEHRSRSGLSQAGEGQQARPIHRIEPGLSASDLAANPAKTATGQESANHSWTEPRSRVGESGPQPVGTLRAWMVGEAMRSRRSVRVGGVSGKGGGGEMARSSGCTLLGYYPNTIRSSGFEGGGGECLSHCQFTTSVFAGPGLVRQRWVWSKRWVDGSRVLEDSAVGGGRDQVIGVMGEAPPPPPLPPAHACQFSPPTPLVILRAGVGVGPDGGSRIGSIVPGGC